MRRCVMLRYRDLVHPRKGPHVSGPYDEYRLSNRWNGLYGNRLRSTGNSSWWRTDNRNHELDCVPVAQSLARTVMSCVIAGSMTALSAGRIMTAHRLRYCTYSARHVSGRRST